MTTVSYRRAHCVDAVDAWVCEEKEGSEEGRKLVGSRGRWMMVMEEDGVRDGIVEGMGLGVGGDNVVGDDKVRWWESRERGGELASSNVLFVPRAGLQGVIPGDTVV